MPPQGAAGSEALTIVARVGFTARGVIYAIVATVLAIATFEPRQRPLGAIGALKAVLTEPLGGAIVLVIAGGLACLAVWLGISALRQGVSGGWVRRWFVHAETFGDAVLYGGFALLVAGAVFGWSGGAGAQRGWAAWLFASAAGRGLAAVAGLVITVSGVGFIVWAWAGDVERGLALPAWQKGWTAPIARSGLTGRGAAIAVVGGYLVAAALDADPTEAHGLGGALTALRATAYGGAMLALFALLFGAAAFYDFLQALYRRAL